MIRSLTLPLAGLLCVAMLGCEPTTGPSGLPIVEMKIGEKTYHLEVAADEKAREHGLMERDDLADDHGMIFSFTTASEQSFWMHHTRFPLDILFVDGDGKIVSVKTMKAYDERNTPSGGESQYAIELAAGEAEKNKAKKGDRLDIPDAALAKNAK